jgi:hypothetical protein
MKPEAYERTLKARAFDVARYLLPLATNTSLGQIVNARTLETQVSRLLSHPAAEVRDLGVKLREAATGPAWNVNAQAAAPSWKRLPLRRPPASPPKPPSRPCSPARSAPLPRWSSTPSPTTTRSRPAPNSPRPPPKFLAKCPSPPRRWSISSSAPRPSKSSWPPTLLYSASHHPYRQIRDLVAGLPEALALRRSSSWACAIAASTTKHCAPFTPERLCALTSSWTSAASATCTAIAAAPRSSSPSPPCTATRPPPPATLAGGQHPRRSRRPGRLSIRHRAAHAASAGSPPAQAPEAAQSALYLLPLATRIRSLFKMDFAEAQYIIELRSGPAGHFSYRRVAWEMFLALQRQHPALAKHIRASPTSPSPSTCSSGTIFCNHLGSI